MGVIDAVRSYFDRGGVGVRLELPGKFMWADGEIPAGVTLTGHQAEPRLVNELRFTVVDDEKPDNTQTPSTGPGSRVRVVWAHDEPIELAAGERRRLELRIPLPAPDAREEVEQEAFGRPAAGFLEKAFAAAARGASPASIHRYRVMIEADVEGASKTKRASKHIQQGRGHTVGVGPLPVKF